jgi:hypothetical protein
MKDVKLFEENVLIPLGEGLQRLVNPLVAFPLNLAKSAGELFILNQSLPTVLFFPNFLPQEEQVLLFHPIGPSTDGQSAMDILSEAGVDSIDVVGIATDYCVRASALDAKAAGFQVRVLTDLVAAVAESSAMKTFEELTQAGVALERSR